MDAFSLQSDFDNLHRWEQQWLMDFNPDKYFVLNVTRKRNPVRNTYNFKDQTVKTTTYFGVEISDDLSWAPYVNKVTKKALKCLGRNLLTS